VFGYWSLCWERSKILKLIYFLPFLIAISAGTHRLHISGVGATGVFDWLNDAIPCQCLGSVHHTDVRKVAPNLLEPVSLMFSWDAEKQRVRRDINFVASVWFRVWIHLMLQTLWNFYLTNWKKEIYLTYQKMLQNIRNSLVDCSQA